MKSRMTFRTWAEIGGLLGLILSLAFVGYEIRQNTRVARAEAYRSFVSEVSDWYLRVSEPEFAALIGRLFDEGYTSVNRAEQLEIFATSMMILRIYEGLHKEVTESGVLDPSALELLSRSEWNFPWFTEEWAELSRNLTPEFVQYMEFTHGLGE